MLRWKKKKYTPIVEKYIVVAKHLKMRLKKIKMFQKIKEKIKERTDGIRLKNSERNWRLYDETPKLKVVWLFAFINQRRTGGWFNSNIILSPVCENNSTIIVNLHKKVTEEAILHIMNHEPMHVAIRNCLVETNYDSDFIETVIDRWMLENELTVNGYDGTVGIRRVQL